jgi:uncharacterized damage-inducible protein DinB
MEKQILYHANVSEVHSFTSVFLEYYKDCGYIKDEVLNKHIHILRQDFEVLQGVAFLARGNTYTRELIAGNSKVNKCFIALKTFVRGNMQLQNEEHAEKAGKIWKLIVHHGVNMHRQGYLVKANLMQKLIDNIMREKHADFLAPLFGVKNALADLSEHTAILQDLIMKSAQAGAKKKGRVEPTAQAKKIKKLLNATILPYLGAMAKMNEETHLPLFKFTSERLAKVNHAVRHRRKKWGKRDGE